jgi:hypothetical protein
MTRSEEGRTGLSLLVCINPKHTQKQKQRARQGGAHRPAALAHGAAVPQQPPAQPAAPRVGLGHRHGRGHLQSHGGGRDAAAAGGATRAGAGGDARCGGAVPTGRRKSQGRGLRWRGGPCGERVLARPVFAVLLQQAHGCLWGQVGGWVGWVGWVGLGEGRKDMVGWGRSSHWSKTCRTASPTHTHRHTHRQTDTHTDRHTHIHTHTHNTPNSMENRARLLCEVLEAVCSVWPPGRLYQHGRRGSLVIYFTHRSDKP